MSRLGDYAKDLAACTYCPSLCLHTCPVSTVEARDSVSPWGKMSLAHYVHRRSVVLNADVAEAFYACAGCGACSEFCVHDVDVEGALFTARATAVSSGAGPYAAQKFLRSVDHVQTLRAVGGEDSRYEPQPAQLLLVGARVLEEAPDVLGKLLRIGRALEDDRLGCGDATGIDVGYGLWAAGFQREFERHARQVREQLSTAQRIIVINPEDLYCLKEIFPRFRLGLDAELLHVSEYLLSLLPGAIISRLETHVTYHDNCQLSRRLDLIEAPRELLRRLLTHPLGELRRTGRETECCGGTGCWQQTSPDSALAASRRVIDLAIEQGVEHLVSFGATCVPLLREAAEGRIKVDDVVSLACQALGGSDD